MRGRQNSGLCLQGYRLLIEGGMGALAMHILRCRCAPLSARDAWTPHRVAPMQWRPASGAQPPWLTGSDASSFIGEPVYCVSYCSPPQPRGVLPHSQV